jgi:CRISPR-associated endonuclease Csn1
LKTTEELIKKKKYLNIDVHSNEKYRVNNVLSMSSMFRKIYGIMGNEKKDRSKHSHHAVDAAVLTLIPGSAKREAILEEAFVHYEQTFNQYHIKPYTDFSVSHVKSIENNILINHVSKDQTLTETKKNLRKRGEIEYLKDKETKHRIKDIDGNKIPLKIQGDSIRGQLHQESYFGAIKPNERNENGYVLKENGAYLLKQKNEGDEIWIVIRKLIENINFEKDVIVDEVLKNHILKQINIGAKENELIDFNGKKIRHLRCRVKAGVGYLSKEKALPIKEHIFKSKHLHKQNYLVQNAENYLYLLYEGKDKNEKTIRGYRILNLLDISKLGIRNIDDLRDEIEYQTLIKGKGKNELTLFLKAILRTGDRVVFYKDYREEITNDNFKDRLFEVFKFNELGENISYVYLINPIEASSEIKSQKGAKEFLPDMYQARLDFTCDKMNCLIENKDFKINNDGSIKWLTFS